MGQLWSPWHRTRRNDDNSIPEKGRQGNSEASWLAILVVTVAHQVSDSALTNVVENNQGLLPVSAWSLPTDTHTWAHAFKLICAHVCVNMHMCKHMTYICTWKIICYMYMNIGRNCLFLRHERFFCIIFEIKLLLPHFLVSYKIISEQDRKQQ